MEYGSCSYNNNDNPTQQWKWMKVRALGYCSSTSKGWMRRKFAWIRSDDKNESYSKKKCTDFQKLFFFPESYSDDNKIIIKTRPFRISSMHLLLSHNSLLVYTYNKLALLLMHFFLLLFWIQVCNIVHWHHWNLISLILNFK